MHRKNLKEKIIKNLNDISLKSKLALLQVFCIIFPLFFTDIFLILSFIHTEYKTNQISLQNISDSLTYTIENAFDYPIKLISNIYSSKYLNNFMTEQYEGPLDYYIHKLQFMKDSLFEIILEKHIYNSTIYTNNHSITNGGMFNDIDTIKNTIWYTELLHAKSPFIVFEDYKTTSMHSKRYLSLAKDMNYYKRRDFLGVIRIDLDYGGIVRDILNAKYDADIYICSSGKILFSNVADCSINAPFEMLNPNIRRKCALHNKLDIYGLNWDVYIMPIPLTVLSSLKNNFAKLLILILLNIGLPSIFMYFIRESFINRLNILNNAVSNGAEHAGHLDIVLNTYGCDEISKLIYNYNSMVLRMNEMIQNEYINKLKQSEINIAKQKAELLALHNQINPHFLFNALESIRMHSVLKKEFETADMVEKLALMERQNVDWGNDRVKIQDEISFINAYLELQKYRFGKKLNYKIDVKDESSSYTVPKLSLVTFVENACKHGMEEKTTTTWIFIRAYKEYDSVIIEIEDTGKGMEEKKCKELISMIKSVNIEMLQEAKAHVGLLNAALRLNIFFHNKVSYEIESELGTGTIISLKVPLSAFN